jgi:hypothetical protein
MTTLPTLDIHKSTPAVVTWQWNDSTRYLAEPDPQIKRVTFTTRFDTTCAFFELSIPIKLKGIKTSSSIILRIPPSSIASFDFVSSTTAPEVIHSKFNSTTVCLDLQLNQHLQILVPADSHEPLHPIRAQGGIVLDAVRQLANATSFSIYVEALALSNTQLQSVRDVISQGLAPVYNDDLASMYGGSGAKIITTPWTLTQNHKERVAVEAGVKRFHFRASRTCSHQQGWRFCGSFKEFRKGTSTLK